MNLQEAIEHVLRENERPMKAQEIALAIELLGYYDPYNENKRLTVSQVYAHIKNYPSIFQNLNGYIVLVYDNTWSNLLTSYENLTEALRGIFNQADIQFNIAVLFCFKRYLDKIPGIESNLGFIYDSLHYFVHGQLSLYKASEVLGEGNTIEDIFAECATTLSKVEENRLKVIERIVADIETRHISDHDFGIYFEYLITSVAFDSIKSSVNNTPYSLRQLMVEILCPVEDRTVCDPVAGIGSLLIEALRSMGAKVGVFGSEINQRITQLGDMNMWVHGYSNVNIKPEDCFGTLNSSTKYDCIIADLPANGITNSVEHYELYKQYGLRAPKTGKSFGSLVLFTLSKLNANGKAVLTVSDGFLAKKGKEQEIRNLLLKQDVIECIISLPHGALRPYTDSKASLLVLNKKKTASLANRIQFITANVADETGKSLILDNDEVLDAYFSKFEKKGARNSQLIPVEDIGPDVNLLAEAYDAKSLLANAMMKEGNAKLLDYLVELRSGATIDKADVKKEGHIPVVKVENLSKDIIDLRLVIANNERVSKESKYSNSIIRQDCILIARIGDNLKATLFTPTDETPSILIHANVYALIPQRNLKLNIEYLYYQLHSVFILEQIEKRKLGAIMPFISISGLKEIIIPYMSVQAQHEFVQSQKANLIAEARKRMEERITALGYKEEAKQAEADVIRTLTHQLRPTFLGINGITKRIGSIIQREDLGDKKEYDNIEPDVDPEIKAHIAKPDNFTLTQLVNKLSGETKHLSDILTSVDKVMNFKLLPEDLKELDVYAFLMEYKQQKEVEQNGKYRIEVKGMPITVLLHKPSFKDLLDQLLINAEKHAFIGEYKNQLNKVQFTVRVDKKRGVVSIEYYNNGKPYELTQKDFITAFEKGSKSDGSGIGGNYISRIVANHRGQLRVYENVQKGFLLIIELPLANIEIHE